MRGGFLVSWTSGHTPPRRLYLLDRGPDGWCTTEDRAVATVFSSPDKAHLAWLKKHRIPEEYTHCIASGQVRAEAVRQPRLPLNGEIQ